MKRNKRAQMEKIKPKGTILIEKRAVKANQKISKKEEKRRMIHKKGKNWAKKNNIIRKEPWGPTKDIRRTIHKKRQKKCPHMNIFTF